MSYFALTSKGALLTADGASTRLLTATTDGYILTLDSTTTLGVKWAAAGSSSVLAAGSTGAVQFNAGGVLGADTANFFWDEVNKRFGINTNVPGNALTVGIDGTAAIPAISMGATADSNTGFFHPATGSLAFSTGGAERLRINSSAIYAGNGQTNSSPANGTISATGGSGTNISGASLTIAGGQSTGTGAGGDIIFQTAAAGSSGSSLNSLSDRLHITTSGNVGVNQSSPNSTLNLGGSMAYQVNTITSNVVLDGTYHIVRVDATSGTVSVQLPTAVGILGREYRIEKIDSTSNAVTVTTTGGQTINGVTTQTLASQYNEAIVVSNNTNWDQLATAAAGSTGFVQFNTAGSLNANSRLFWDNTNFRLGINQTPSEKLHILVSSLDSQTGIQLQGAGNASVRYGLSVAHTGIVGQVGLVDNPGDFYTGTTFGDLLLDGGRIAFATNNTALRGVWDTNGNLGIGTTTPTAALHVSPPVFTSGSHPSILVTAAASTNQTAGTELSDINFNLARTLQFATGAITTQRAALVQAPTYAFVGASTITNAATLAVTGAPVAGTNATITNPYAFWIQGGNARFDGYVGINQVSPNSNFQINGSMATAIVIIRSTTTLNSTHYTVLADVTSGSIVINLPSTSGIIGRIYLIKKIDGTANAITITPATSQFIDGQTTFMLGAQNESIIIQTDGSNWFTF